MPEPLLPLPLPGGARGRGSPSLCRGGRSVLLGSPASSGCSAGRIGARSGARCSGSRKGKATGELWGPRQPRDGPRGLRAPTGGRSKLPAPAHPRAVGAVPGPGRKGGPSSAALRAAAAPHYNSQPTPRRGTTTPGAPRAGQPSHHCACAAAGRGRGMRGGGSAVIGGARRDGGAAAAILGAGQRAAAAAAGEVLGAGLPLPGGCAAPLLCPRRLPAVGLAA